jgi:ribosomal protein L25 (general stress protein Ctc)
MFGETVAVYCGTRKSSSYLTGNTLRLRYRDQAKHQLFTVTIIGTACDPVMQAARQTNSAHHETFHLDFGRYRRF